MSHEITTERIIQTILAAIDHLTLSMGAHLLAKTLSGSEHHRVTDNDLHTTRCHGQLDELTDRQIVAATKVLLEAALLTRAKFACLKLTPMGRELLDSPGRLCPTIRQSVRDAIQEQGACTRSKRFVSLSSTLRQTLELLDQHKSLGEIADQREITRGSVADHLLALAEQGVELDLHRFVDHQRLQQVQRAARGWGVGDPLSDVRDALEGQWQWHEIKACLAAVVSERNCSDRSDGASPPGRQRSHDRSGGASDRSDGASPPGRQRSHDRSDGASPPGRQRSHDRSDGASPPGRQRSHDRSAGASAPSRIFQLYRSEDSPWYCRGYLPHCDRRDRPQFITYRLADALPQKVLERLHQQKKAGEDITSHLQEKLDAGYGACWLKRDKFAEVIVENLHYHAPTRYRLLDWVIMPNHVHILYDKPTVPLEKITHGWKSYTAHKLKPQTDLSDEDSFWQRGVYDRYIRDAGHLSNVTNYIYLNPVKAGLVKDPFDWKWSSIHKHDDIRESLNSWWRAHSDDFWKAPLHDDAPGTAAGSAA